VGGEVDTGAAWRIDELARRCGLEVGTVRLYQRQGLLPPGRRQGRSMVYGLAHLDRLVRVRQLKARGFTLTAIKRMLDEGRFVMLDRVLGPDGRPRTRRQLVEESGLDAALVREFEEIGVLVPPSERGADGYDGADTRFLQAVAQLVELGTPPPMLSVVLPIYVGHLRALQRDLIGALSGPANLGPELPADVVADYGRRAAAQTEEFLRCWDVIVDYLHHRMIQRLVHLARSHSDGPGPAEAASPATA